MKKYKISKGSPYESLIIPLYARKFCSEYFKDYYKDEFAKIICDKLDYDFSSFDKKTNSILYQFGALEGATRELDMSFEIKDFLKKNKKSSLICLGAGLSTTSMSVADRNCKIYNIDFEDVIKIRDNILKNPKEKNIACDINDYSWIQEIEDKENVLFYASGVFYYFKIQDIKNLLEVIAKNFKNARIVFDSVGKFGRDILFMKTLKKFGIDYANEGFYISNTKELASLSDSFYVVRRKRYMSGYYKLSSINIKLSHKFLSFVTERLAKMYINVLELKK